jgi:hypothetical protein
MRKFDFGEFNNKESLTPPFLHRDLCITYQNLFLDISWEKLDLVFLLKIN